MVLPEIDDIKYIRKKMDLSLRKLAKKSGLSVSWISQVESGGIKDPSYLKIKKIFDLYEFEKSGNERTAGDICVPEKDMKSCKIGSSVESANKIMIEKDISQVPVFEKNVCVGMITDKIITSFVGSDVSGVKIVEEMLEIAPPRVDVKTPVRSLKRTLDYFDYVLVEKNGYIFGILARHDLMKLLNEGKPKRKKYHKRN
jgi:predicted transcriptional regulator